MPHLIIKCHFLLSNFQFFLCNPSRTNILVSHCKEDTSWCTFPLVSFMTYFAKHIFNIFSHIAKIMMLVEITLINIFRETYGFTFEKYPKPFFYAWVQNFIMLVIEISWTLDLLPTAVSSVYCASIVPLYQRMSIFTTSP